MFTTDIPIRTEALRKLSKMPTSYFGASSLERWQRKTEVRVARVKEEEGFHYTPWEVLEERELK